VEPETACEAVAALATRLRWTCGQVLGKACEKAGQPVTLLNESLIKNCFSLMEPD